MSRERPRQHGASNVSARAEQQKIRASPLVSSQEPTQFYRSWTHKLVSPDVYLPPDADRTKERKIRETATWRSVHVHRRTFLTTHTASYRDPQHQKPPPELHAITLAEVKEKEARQEKELDAMMTLTKMAKKHFGTTAAMLKPFRKRKSGGDLTLKEFGRYIEQNGLSEVLTPDEQKHVFNSVDPSNQGKVPVMALMRKAEEQEFLDHEHAESILKVRNFLADHVEHRRKMKEEESHKKDTDLEERKKTKAVANERDQIAKALGQKTFDLDISHDELHEVLRDLYHKLPTNEEHRKFARFLRFSNLDLGTIQFYDMRHEELENLKTRAAMIDRYLEDPDKLKRLEELSETRWNSSLATTNHDYYPPGLVEELNNPIMTRIAARDIIDRSFTDTSGEHPLDLGLQPEDQTSTPQQSKPDSHLSQNNEKSTVSGKMMLSKSLPSLPVTARPSPLSKPSAEFSQQLMSGRSNAGEIQSIPEHGSDIYDIGKGAPLSPLSPASPMRMMGQSQSEAILSGERERGGSGGRERLVPLKLNKATSVGAIQKNKTDKPRNLLKDSKGMAYEELSNNKSTVAADNIGKASLDGEVGPVLPQKASKLKKEIFDDPPSASDFYAQIVDESASMGRVKDPTKVMRIEKIDPHAYMPTGKKVYSNGDTDWTRVGIGGDRDPDFVGYGRNEESTFLTTNQKYYPPLIYEPSKSVARDLVSEAELARRKREKYRNERYARMKANMDVTAVRLEHDALEKDIRQMRRAQNRLEDRIRYHTSMFLHDLTCYKQQPLQRMSKKQNMDAAERMWRGNAKPQNVQLTPDQRDFKSTYNADFDSSILKDNEIINRE